MPDSTAKRLSVLLTARVAFALALIALAAISIVSYQSLSAPVAAARWVDRSLNVEGEIKAMLAAVLSAQSGQRGYLLTGLEEYLPPYETGVAAVFQHLQKIESLTADSPEHQENLRLLRPLVEEKMRDLGTTLQLYRDGERMAAVLRVRANAGARTREILEAMLDDESELRRRREATHAASVARAFAVTQAGSAILFVLLGLAAWTSRREERIRQLVQRELEAQLGELRAVQRGTEGLPR